VPCWAAARDIEPAKWTFLVGHIEIRNRSHATGEWLISKFVRKWLGQARFNGRSSANRLYQATDRGNGTNYPAWYQMPNYKSLAA
jgi:hypothetical protein